ncbi:MAG: hypothetical protein JNM34_06270 [Chthonomonadaceae bacterium]|jgi:hypothetical protein|nr:hypothetical protein [Chthonomonadaceae bacterium]
MKAALLVSLLPCVGMAQPSPRDVMDSALDRLAMSDKVAVTTLGAEVRGTRVVDVKVTIAFYYKPLDHVLRLEAMTWEDAKLVSRQVADGEVLWDFDARANTYSSLVYGDLGKLLPNWKSKVFRTLRLRTSGVTAFTFRLLDDAFGPGRGIQAWTPWVPMARSQMVDKSIQFTAKSPGPNKTTYGYDGDPESGYRLLGAAFRLWDSDEQAVLKRWDTALTVDSLPDNTDFGFTPPRGAKPVVIDQRLGG